MELPDLTGAQRTRLRGLGQTTAESAWIGRDGVTPEFLAALNKLLTARELVKVRFSAGQDRQQRAALCAAVASAAPCQCVGAVGHTALFWRPGPAGAKLLAAPPEAPPARSPWIANVGETPAPRKIRSSPS